MNAQVPPGLPAYEPPKPRVPASVPESVKSFKPHGILNKVIGRSLKGPALKQTFRMMTTKKNPRPISKPKKKKIV